MKFSFFLGIDVSKEKVDLSLHEGTDLLYQNTCLNKDKHLKQMFGGLVEEFKIETEELLICAEYTGMYSHPLHRTTSELGLNLWLEHPATIKLSGGIQRHKNDAIDAKRLAVYAFRYQDKAQLAGNYDSVIVRLKYLHSERRLLVSDRAKYQGQLTDQPGYLPKEMIQEKKKRLRQIIKTFTKQIAVIEKLIHQIIQGHDHLKLLVKLITSIKGVGPQLAHYILISTSAFKKIINPRKYCCHVGVAPFSFSSGSSQRSKSRVSNRADKQGKTILHMAAMSAIQHNPELKEYYLRKTGEGKAKMKVINAVRAKLVHRIFALVRDQREYELFYTPNFV